MAERRQKDRRELLSFEKGLNEYLEPSRIGNGQAVILSNWHAEPDGSLRARIGNKRGSATDAPGTRIARAIAYMPLGIEPTYVYGNKDGGNYKLYSIPKADLTGGAWDLVDTVAAADTDKFLSTTVGLGNLFYCTDDFAAIHRWNGDDPAAVVVGSPPGRAILVYRSRLFSFGGPATDPDVPGATQVYRGRFSNAGDYATWDNADYFDVKEDDGEAIESVAPYDNGILMGKENSLHYLLGQSRQSFQQVELDGGGAAPGQSIVATPFGAVICGRSQVWMFQGAQPEPISRRIEASYGITGEFASCAYLDGKVFIADEGQAKLFVYDMLNEAWHIEEFDNAAEDGPVVLTSQAERLLLAPRGSTTEPPLQFRQYPDGERGRDEGRPQTYRMRTPSYWLGGAIAPATVNHVYLRIRQRGGTASDNPLRVTLFGEGEEQGVERIEPKHGAVVFSHRIDWGFTGYEIFFDFELPLDEDENAVMDIEEIILVCDIEGSR